MTYSASPPAAPHHEQNVHGIAAEHDASVWICHGIATTIKEGKTPHPVT
jgi:hypothetical protein